jgi:uncharacterized protein (UPF0548 family)
VKLGDLATLRLTYDEVGATAGPLPPGYHHLHQSAVVGSGRARYEDAAAAVMRWGMQRGAGLKVTASTDVAEVGTLLLVRIGPLHVPCRVVYVLDEPDRRGFAYGTLPGHPESGEELFAVRFDPATDAVHAEITAFSRPRTWWSRLAFPAASIAQRVIGSRYLTGV